MSQVLKQNDNAKNKLKIVCYLFDNFAGSNAQKGDQEDPCKLKARVIGDVTYCDRYWECINNQPELYDCPNGLVFAGKHRGVTEGCDYPWRSNYCEGKQLASKYDKCIHLKHFVESKISIKKKIRWSHSNRSLRLAIWNIRT